MSLDLTDAEKVELQKIEDEEDRLLLNSAGMTAAGQLQALKNIRRQRDEFWRNRG